MALQDRSLRRVLLLEVFASAKVCKQSNALCMLLGASKNADMLAAKQSCTACIIRSAAWQQFMMPWASCLLRVCMWFVHQQTGRMQHLTSFDCQC